MKHLFNLYIILFVLLFSACSLKKDIDFDTSNYEQKVIVNGLFTINEPLTINLSLSRQIDTASLPEYLDSAMVLLFENEILIDTLKKVEVPVNPNLIYAWNHKGYYQSNSILHENKNYKITVTNKDYPLITAKSYIPQLIDTPIVYIKDSAKYAIGSSFQELVQLSFYDDASTENYYYITVGQTDISDSAFYNQLYFDCKDISIPNSSPYLNNETHGYIYFNDELFNGQTKTLNLYVDDFYLNMKTWNGSEEVVEPVYVNIYCITKDYYEYVKSADEQQYIFWGGTNGIIVPDPIQVYSNINNGLGIFSGYQSMRILINK